MVMLLKSISVKGAENVETGGTISGGPVEVVAGESRISITAPTGLSEISVVSIAVCWVGRVRCPGVMFSSSSVIGSTVRQSSSCKGVDVMGMCGSVIPWLLRLISGITEGLSLIHI